MIVAAHQPAYLPWLGYLHKLATCDVFVVLDDVQYEGQNFQNRNRVKINNGVAWLTVPVEHGPQDERICDKRISYQQSPREAWRRRTWRTLVTHYGRAAHFARYAEELEEIYRRPWERLVELDMHLLQLFMRWLDISRPVLRTSTMDVSGSKTARIVEICRRVGADVYLSGSGGSAKYLDTQQMAAAGVRVMWQQFRHPSYAQRYPHLGFVPNLGCVDLIFNCGPASRDILMSGGVENANPESGVAAGGVLDGQTWTGRGPVPGLRIREDEA